MSKLAKALTAAAGNAGESLYVDDVFSTYLYTGNGSSQTITNGIDLAGKGGAIWFKSRSNATNHRIFDTDRGRSVALTPDTTAANGAVSPAGDDLASFNSDGFTLGAPFHYGLNTLNRTYASWSFREAEKFFDVVTYTGNGANGREIPHSLNGDVGMVIVKCTSDADQWLVWHKNTSTGYLRLDGTGALVTSFAQFKFGNGTTTVNPTSSVFTVAGDSDINGSGRTYVAYLFASDAGGFGDDGSESIIKCGSFTTGAQGKISSPVDCGFEPQWLLVKNAGASENWNIYDVMRGLTVGADAILHPNLSNAEDNTGTKLTVTATGFDTPLVNGPFASGATYIYIAIRRPMKTPASGTEVFEATSPANGTGSNTIINSNFTVDLILNLGLSAGIGNSSFDRLRGRYLQLLTDETTQEVSRTDTVTGFDVQKGFTVGTGSSGYVNNASYNYNNLLFKRATGFMDVVAYTGNGTAGHTLNHNLGVAPELIIIKDRDAVTGWYVGVNFEVSAFDQLQLQSTNAASSRAYSHGIDAKPTANLFSVGVNTFTNTSSENYIAYLFATLAGVSKVGSYTGTGADLNVDCGFSAGARFILIKRTDSTGDWYVWDSARGIVAGNDPYLLLNTNAAEITNTDYVDPLSSGFTVTSNASGTVNVSSGTYIFLAIA